jgi:hypothetical protein
MAQDSCHGAFPTMSLSGLLGISHNTYGSIMPADYVGGNQNGFPD